MRTPPLALSAFVSCALVAGGSLAACGSGASASGEPQVAAAPAAKKKPKKPAKKPAAKPAKASKHPILDAHNVYRAKHCAPADWCTLRFPTSILFSTEFSGSAGMR